MCQTPNIEQIISILDDIDSLENTIRDHINTHSHQIKLIDDNDKWLQICSCLDILGDTCLAIRSYLTQKTSNDQGIVYLYLYGILQVLYVQQQGLANLYEAFGIEYKQSNAMDQIRHKRNISIGHPTKNRKHSFNFIARSTMSEFRFQLQSFTSDDFVTYDINVYELIESQITEINRECLNLSNKLKELDIMHKDKYKSLILSDIIPKNSYIFSKISSGICSLENDLGTSSLPLAITTTNNLKNNTGIYLKL